MGNHSILLGNGKPLVKGIKVTLNLKLIKIRHLNPVWLYFTTNSETI